jgi:solute carrier family 25, member 39/40
MEAGKRVEMPGSLPGSTIASGSSSRAPPSTLYGQIVASALGGSMATFILNPIAVIKVRMQNERERGPSSISRAARSVMRHDGVMGFWRGSTAGLLQTVPNAVAYMVVYEKLKLDFARRNTMESVGLPGSFAPGIAASLARTVAISITSPIELIRTLKLSGMKGGLVDIGTHIFRSEGMKGLYRGWLPTVWRDVPYSAVYWVTYERLRWPLKDTIEEVVPGISDTNSSVVGNFVAGAIGGVLATFVTHPFDVLKTRRQIDAKAETSTLSGMLRIEGLRSLTRGLALRLATVIPGGAIMVTVYEFVKVKVSSQTL